jgi:MFS family permease
MEHNIERATCIGMLSSVINLAVVFGALIGGAISQFLGFKATMYAAAALTAIGFCFFRAGIGRGSLSSKSFLCSKKMRMMVRATLKALVRRRIRVKKMLKGERSS